ncbi:MAG: MBL fold metallo-hydrolase [Bacteroidales bacterium]|nr:MBL fold metallo-hydrolase [Bacteroidales bacterium]
MKFRMFTAITIALIMGVLFVYYSVAPKLGGKNSNEKLLRLQLSDNFNGKKFINLVPTAMAAPKFSTMIKFFSSSEEKAPTRNLPTKKFLKESFESANSDKISFTWFGHSSVLLKIENQVILIDPVFGERVSLFSLVGPKKFNYSNYYSIDQLPHIDAVLISHDHYDHLEYESMLALKDKVNRFFVPLGVGVHLEEWGIDSEKIIELDWWDDTDFNKDIKLIFTPTRHFTGRGILNRDRTLWGSWAIIGQNHKVFFSGDSGYFDVFKKVGEKYGPFDLAFIENGQYNEDWKAIHMMPEQSALAGSELNAKAVVPIHWGKFSLSLHAWDEPVKRFLVASKSFDYKALTPTPGEILTYPWHETSQWWKN